MKNYFQIVQAAGSKKADVYIFGDITQYSWFDDEVSAKQIVDQLRDIDADEITVHIDSRGGSIQEGWAMYSVLKQHPAKIITRGEGFVASAALYPFLAGDERIASSVSAFYLHEGMTYASGYAADLEKAAAEIKKLTEIGIVAFTETTGQSAETIRDMMAKETWLNPEEAKELNIATEVEAREDAGASQDLMEAILRKMKAPEQKVPEPKRVKSVIEMMAKK